VEDASLSGRQMQQCPADYPGVTMELMERAAGKVDVPLYAIDDQTAINVVDGAVTVVSEGDWSLFEK
jgi:dipeptidase E